MASYIGKGGQVQAGARPTGGGGGLTSGQKGLFALAAVLVGPSLLKTLYEKPNKYQQPLALNFQGKEVLKQSTKIQKRNKRKRKGTGRKKKGEGNRRTKRKERKETASRFYSGGSCAGWSASPTG